ncbi:SDR family NAD(P)-dependent oxidoreductase [Mucisphaera calidilacus]|uniref:3-oxoacyl-[acyl-carrier-protein] reductase FabG n=1 Tax=Mucisphaera calidilacus TaxID=2527982 RepID=A0A518C0F8_9BACT|nr:SDR family NAD(P)-dependent oxidoreductase [Mucisphaera calidilacus]QDU72704.1 3-oxoacyl-[acyl-carrier-protein] reductase FabG [Mucisphaera calidilacus]
MKRDLQGKVLAVTGASSGIGAATAIEAARRGMNVALCARRTDKLEEVACKIVAEGGQAAAIPCNVADPASVEHFIAETVQRLGRLDVVYANAGYGLVKDVLEMTDEEHRAIFETNYFGTLNTIKAAMPALRAADNGLRHVIVCSSVVSEISLPECGAYCATKAAQDGLAGSLRFELEPEGFKVTTVHPVGTTSEFFTTAAEISGHRPQRRVLPSGLKQTPEHVGRRIVAAIQRPRAEVWPMLWVRFGLGIATMFPALGRMGARKHQAPVD